jgi:hypothetical protein
MYTNGAFIGDFKKNIKGKGVVDYEESIRIINSMRMTQDQLISLASYPDFYIEGNGDRNCSNSIACQVIESVKAHNSTKGNGQLPEEDVFKANFASLLAPARAELSLYKWSVAELTKPRLSSSSGVAGSSAELEAKKRKQGGGAAPELPHELGPNIFSFLIPKIPDRREVACEREKQLKLVEAAQARGQDVSADDLERAGLRTPPGSPRA